MNENLHQTALRFVPDFLDIIIVGYNEAHNVPRTFRAANIAAKELEKELAFKTNIVYVDSYSSDNSCEVAKSFGLEVFMAPKAFHTCANGRNAGMFLTSGEYIQFLDADMQTHNDWLVKGIKFLQDHPKAAGVRGIRDDVRLIKNKQVIIKNYTRVKKDIEILGNQSGGSFLFRRVALMDIYGYEPDLYEEDIYLNISIQERGWEMYQIAVPMIIHWDTKVSSLSAVLKKQIFARNAMVPGALLRYTISQNKCWLGIASYYKYHLIHGVFLSLTALIILSILFIGQYRFTLSIAFLTFFAGYIGFQIFRKRNIVLGCLALLFETAYFINMVIGFILNYPKIRFGFQFKKDYIKMIKEANRVK